MARVKHGQDDWLSYHITTRTIDKQFYLASDVEKHRIVQALDFYRRKAFYRLFGFVVMSNHVHFIIQPLPGVSLSKTVRNIKAWTSQNNQTKPTHQPLWERRYDDNRIRSSKELWSVLDYIHANPVRAGMASAPGAYQWSSIGNYNKDYSPPLKSTQTGGGIETRRDGSPAAQK